MICVSEPDIGSAEIIAVIETLMSKRLAQGPKVKEFEARFAKYIGTNHCVATCNGTSALHAALIACGIKPGDKVIVPPLSFFATVEAVMHCGAIPVFADIDDTWNINDRTITEVITHDIKAIIPVHIFGNPAERAVTSAFSYKQDDKIKMIEDCAQAHGAIINGQKIGSFGEMAAWSFYATKNMTTGGEGGAITLNHTGQYEYLKTLVSHGMTSPHLHLNLGYNYRMSEIAAAIGLVQLSKLDMMNEMRIKRSKILIEKLKDVNWLVPQRVYPGCESVYFWAGFWVDKDKLGYDAHWLKEYLEKDFQIETRFRYFEPLYKQPVIEEKFGIQPELPNAEKICGNLIGFPNHPGLSIQDINYIADALISL